MKQNKNILFFMTDHQRFDTMGMVQCGREVTPNLNRLAEEGMVFERAYDTCPLCVPARTALATGVYPTNNGVVYNDWKGKTAGKFTPIHKILQNTGYCVGHVGVDHIKVQPPMREQGLDYFINQEDYEKWAAEQGVETVRKPEELIQVEEEIEGSYEKKLYSGHLVSKWEKPFEQFKDSYFLQQSLNFLRSQKGDNPFALFTYLWAPHPPLRVPEPYASMYDPDQIVLPDNIALPSEQEPAVRRRGVPAQLAQGVTMEEWRKVWAAHLALTTMADEILGTLLDELKRMGVYKDTCIVFTVDHGDHLGQHNMYQKMEMYEEAVKIPLVVKMPGGKTGRTDTLVSHLDIKPTLCEMIGAEAGVCDGMSLMPLFRGESMPEDRCLYIQYSGNPGYGTIRRAVVSRQYKYVFDSSYEHELYDLVKDPSEMYNVAGEEAYQQIKAQMYEACKAYHQEKKDYFDWEGQEEKK